MLVVGAGLAGLQCSRLLSESGLRVLLIDRKPSLEQSIHTTGIFVRRTLEDFPLPEDCLGPVVRHVTLYSPARRSMELVSPLDEFRVGRMGALYRRFLDRCLHAGVAWKPSTSYVAATRVNHEEVVCLESGGIPQRIAARYIVGADGAGSRVAADLKLDQNQESIVGVEEVLENVPLDGPPRFHCFLDPRVAPGYLAWLVHDGEQVHLGVGGYPSQFETLKALREFRASLSDIVDLREAKLIDRRGGSIPVGGVLRNIANDRGLLVGDAAGAVSPLTAGGLDPCMRLSTFAANVISNYLRTNNREALKVYSGRLFRTRFGSRLWMRHIIRSFTQRPLLELGCALIRQPVLSSLAWHVFCGRGSFPDLPSLGEAEPRFQPNLI